MSFCSTIAIQTIKKGEKVLELDLGLGGPYNCNKDGPYRPTRWEPTRSMSTSEGLPSECRIQFQFSKSTPLNTEYEI